MRKLAILTLLPLLAVLSGSAQVQESDYYQIETFPIPKGIIMEVSGLLLLEDGRLMAATRLGEIYLIENFHGDPAEAQFKLWAAGLSHPLGLVEHNGWIYTAQRAELTRMKDSNGDGRADLFETVSDQWEISGNYHEYNFGPALDPEGYLWVSLNKPFGNEPYGFAHWRGWALRIHPETGRTFPMAVGLRSPAGIETSPWGGVFVTDNEGEWCNASKLAHIEFGDFHGHPHGLPTKELAGPPFSDIAYPESGRWMKDLHQEIPSFKMPAVWFPYDKMGKSPSGMKWDLTEGRFGPFAGQLFVGDQHHASVMRVDLERIEGHWQGACFPFRSGLQSGVIRLCFGLDNALYVGMSNAGWGSRGNSPWGLQRIRWTGKIPFTIESMKAHPDGFVLRFTRPADREAAGNPANYRMESYTYRLESRYGGPEDDKQDLKIVSATVSQDGKQVQLTIDPLRAGYVHELHLDNIQAEDGTAMLHSSAYYTLVKIPGPQTASRGGAR